MKEVNLRVSRRPVVARLPVQKPVVARSQDVRLNLQIDGAYQRSGLFNRPNDAAHPTDSLRLTFGRPVSDAVARYESLSFSAGRVHAELAATSETLSNDVERVSSDGFLASNSVSLSPSKVLSDAASRTDVLWLSYGKFAADLASAPDSVVRDVAAVRADPATVVETAIRYVEKVLEDLVVTADSVDPTTTFVRDLLDEADAYDHSFDTNLQEAGGGVSKNELSRAIERMEVATDTPRTDTFGRSDLATMQPGKVLSDAVLRADTSWTDVSKALVDSQLVLETVAVNAGKALADVSVAAEVTDLNFERAYAEGVSRSDLLTSSVGKAAADPVYSLDNVFRTDTSKVIAETAHPAEAASALYDDYFLGDFAEPGYTGTVSTII